MLSIEAATSYISANYSPPPPSSHHHQRIRILLFKYAEQTKMARSDQWGRTETDTISCN